MYLVIENTRTIENPSDAQIAEALQAARFAFLSSEPDSPSYLQFARSRTWGIEIEYQVDSLDHHFLARDPSFTIEHVIRAFQQYARGDDAWQTALPWQQLDATILQGQKVVLTPERQHPYPEGVGLHSPGSR